MFFVATVDVDEQRIIKMINEECEREYKRATVGERLNNVSVKGKAAWEMRKMRKLSGHNYNHASAKMI
jgi:hypothetical protein